MPGFGRSIWRFEQRLERINADMGRPALRRARDESAFVARTGPWVRAQCINDCLLGRAHRPLGLAEHIYFAHLLASDS